jgi:hypothetical protein
MRKIIIAAAAFAAMSGTAFAQSDDFKASNDSDTRAFDGGDMRTSDVAGAPGSALPLTAGNDAVIVSLGDDNTGTIEQDNGYAFTGGNYAYALQYDSGNDNSFYIQQVVATPAFGENRLNRASVEQRSDDSSADIRQFHDGSPEADNLATVHQGIEADLDYSANNSGMGVTNNQAIEAGSDRATASIVQGTASAAVNGNQALIGQSGDDQVASIEQYSSGNRALVLQDDDDAGSDAMIRQEGGGFNEAMILQDDAVAGAGNVGMIFQGGFNNSHAVVQGTPGVTSFTTP